MNLFKTFGTDKDMEKDGIWIQYGETPDGKPVRFRIARAGGANTEYAKASEKALKPYRKMIQNDALEEELAQKILRKVFVDTVLLGWENVRNIDDKDIPFSKENAIDLFTKLPDLLMDLRKDSEKTALFKAEVREADLGNSGPSSATV